MSTALVVVTPSDSAPSFVRVAGARPQAEFLTQLIAAKAQVAQMRARRRAEPDEAVAAYAAQDRVKAPAGRALARSL
jgi:hypothetical protein